MRSKLPADAGRLGDVREGCPGVLAEHPDRSVKQAAMLYRRFSHYQPVTGPPPRRPRTDHNPLDRKEYLLRVMRRV